MTTKALPDITDDARDTEPLLCKAEKRKSAIVLIQNGVGIKKAHRTRFPRNPVISAVTIVSAEQTATVLYGETGGQRLALSRTRMVRGQDAGITGFSTTGGR